MYKAMFSFLGILLLAAGQVNAALVTNCQGQLEAVRVPEDADGWAKIERAPKLGKSGTRTFWVSEEVANTPALLHGADLAADAALEAVRATGEKGKKVSIEVVQTQLFQRLAFPEFSYQVTVSTSLTKSFFLRRVLVYFNRRTRDCYAVLPFEDEALKRKAEELSLFGKADTASIALHVRQGEDGGSPMHLKARLKLPTAYKNSEFLIGGADLAVSQALSAFLDENTSKESISLQDVFKRISGVQVTFLGNDERNRFDAYEVGFKTSNGAIFDFVTRVYQSAITPLFYAGAIGKKGEFALGTLQPWPLKTIARSTMNLKSFWPDEVIFDRLLDLGSLQDIHRRMARFRGQKANRAWLGCHRDDRLPLDD